MVYLPSEKITGLFFEKKKNYGSYDIVLQFLFPFVILLAAEYELHLQFTVNVLLPLICVCQGVFFLLLHAPSSVNAINANANGQAEQAQTSRNATITGFMTKLH